MDYYSPFWGLKAISIVVEPRGALTCRSSTLAVLGNSGLFMAYYSLFWGPKEISIFVEPQGVLACWSSRRAVLADFGPFRGLLLTVLGSRSDVHE